VLRLRSELHAKPFKCTDPILFAFIPISCLLKFSASAFLFVTNVEIISLETCSLDGELSSLVTPALVAHKQRIVGFLNGSIVDVNEPDLGDLQTNIACS
jgi:hypothetical protein